MDAAIIIEKIKNIFDNKQWHYKYDGRSKIFRLGIEAGDAVGKIDCIIKVNKVDYTVLAIMNAKANNKSIDEISKFLHKLNYDLKWGNFELDLDDGEIHYKTHVVFDGCEISDKVIYNSILLPIVMISNYGNDIIKIIMDKL